MPVQVFTKQNFWPFSRDSVTIRFHLIKLAKCILLHWNEKCLMFDVEINSTNIIRTVSLMVMGLR